jgi:N-acetylglucosamine-6-phosphate deacetylase
MRFDGSLSELEVDSWPVEFHCHGVRDFDFSDFDRLDLCSLNRYLRHEQVLCVPTVYLPRSRLHGFVRLMREFARLSRDGELPNIPGFAVEGPLLSSFGGTPGSGAWQPTHAEWDMICSCGPLGLRYVVVSPDFATPGSGLAAQRDRSSFGLEWAIQHLLDHGIAPAMGHFLKSDPKGSAACISVVLGVAADRDLAARLITDHLFNDMPLLFSHAWRGAEARARRTVELTATLQTPWAMDNLNDTIGPVPAALIQAAGRGDLTLCMNFDGEHVDLAFCERVLELVGADAMILMTDRTEARVLAGQQLHKMEDSSLWYQEDSVVAAGSTPIDRQIANLRTLGADGIAVRALTSANPRRVLGI